MAQGLIAAAIGGFGKALSTIGEMEAKKQNEAKLRKELMDMESEERLRLDEITFGREMERAPIRAKTTAEANVLGEAAGYEAADKANLPALRAKAEVGKKTAQYAAEAEAGLTTIEAKREAERLKAGLTAKSEAGLPEAQGAYAAREKIEARLAELNLSALKNLSALEAKAKYDALVADLDAAEKSGIDVKEAKRKANIILAEITAKKEAGVPKAEAGYAADKRLEEIRAATEKNLIQEEAGLLAKQELAKVQAMTAQGVPEAEAKLLAAKWRAGKTLRDEAAAEKTQQEINDAITKGKNKGYLTAERQIAATKHFASGSGKPRDEVNTADLARKLDAAESDLAEALGVSKNKVSEELRWLEESAKKDPAAKQKLDDIKPLRDAVKKRRADLQNWRDKPEEAKNESTASKNSGKKPSIESFNK